MFALWISISWGLLVHVLLPVSDDMIKTTLLVTWMFPVGVAIISYGIQFKYRTLSFIGMTTNLTIIISIIILYVSGSVCLVYTFENKIHFNSRRNESPFTTTCKCIL